MLFLTIFYSAQAIAYYIPLHLGADASQVARFSKQALVLPCTIGAYFPVKKKRIYF